MSSAYRKSFNFFSHLDEFFLSCLIALIMTFNITFYKSGDSRHSCLVLILEEKLFIIEYDVSCGLLAFIMLRYVPSICTLMRDFIINRCWILWNAFYAPVEVITWFLSFTFLMWWITVTDLQLLNHDCIPGINTTWLWCMIFSTHYWKLFANILLRVLHLCSARILA